MPKLTKRLIESTPAQKQDILLWDNELKGFLCKVTPKGKRIYLLYYRTLDGRQRRPKIGDHGSITCEQAREIAKEWLGAIARGEDPSANKQFLKTIPTLRQLAERYMVEYAPRKKASSRKEDQRLWNQHILNKLGDLKASAITREDIIALHSSYQNFPILGNRILSLLSKAFNLAELWGYRPDGSNPCLHVKKYPEKKRERFLSQGEVLNLLNILDEEEREGSEYPSVIAALRLLLFTGCRLNEILSLRWKEVDFERGCLRLEDSKTGDKVVYLSPGAIDILKTIPKEEGNPYVITGKKKESHLINLQKPWRRIRKKAGLDDVRIHDLRHTFASVAAASGLSLPMIGALLGHKQTQTTARYAHLVGKPLQEAVAQIELKLKNNN